MSYRFNPFTGTFDEVGGSPPRQERFIVTTNGDGVADISFSQPFANPHIALAVKAVRSDERATWAEFTNLTSNGVRIKTTLAGRSESLLGLIVFVPPSFESATVHVTVTELG